MITIDIPATHLEFSLLALLGVLAFVTFAIAIAISARNGTL